MKRPIDTFIPIPMLKNITSDLTDYLIKVRKNPICNSTVEDIIEKHKDEWRKCQDLDLWHLTVGLRNSCSEDLARDVPALKKWISESMIVGRDETASEIVSDLFGIDVDSLAESLVELNAFDPQIVTSMLEGKIGTASKRIPANGFGQADGDIYYSPEMIIYVVAAMLKVWIARGLQLKAFATREFLFRPIGMQFFDHSKNGLPVRQDTAVNRAMPTLDMLERALELYHRKGSSLAQGNAKPPASDCYILRWPTRGNKQASAAIHTKRDATAEEAAYFPMELQLQAQKSLDVWGAAHANDLEYQVERRMREVYKFSKTYRHRCNQIMNDKSAKRQRTNALFGETPLLRLWLAVRNVVLWITPPVATKKGRDGQRITQVIDYAELAVTAARTGKALPPLKFRQHHTQIARELFFALRCTIVRDPEHLPKPLRKVTTLAGQTTTASNRERAEEMRGQAFTLAEIFCGVRAIIGERNSKEILSHKLTGKTNKFLAGHYSKPTPDSCGIMKRASCTAPTHLSM